MFVAALIVSFVALVPVSIRLADPLFTHPFHPEWPHDVLLVWPDHVEMRSFDDISEVSPRPKDAGYTFNISPERQTWVEHEVQRARSPLGNAAWAIRVRQLGPSRQWIQLELVGDGMSGMVYEAGPDGIVPLRSRLAGPGSAIVILGVNVLMCAGLWSVASLAVRRFRRGARQVHDAA